MIRMGPEKKHKTNNHLKKLQKKKPVLIIVVIIIIMIGRSLAIMSINFKWNPIFFSLLVPLFKINNNKI